jgi:NADH dehydrogenase
VKILVVGGTGFVGQKIVHTLRARSHDVRALVRKRDGRAKTLQTWGCELVDGDVTDPQSLRKAADGVDCVVHLVAIIKGRPEDFERVMAQGTRDLLAAAEAGGARRFVLMSALGTSEHNRELVPYFRAKWDMEQAAKASLLEDVIFRPSFVFGADGGILQMFMRQVRFAPVTPIVGPGTGRLQPIWVEDVAAFFAESVSSGAAAGRTFELGGLDAVTWNELYDRIRRVLAVHRRPTLHVPVGLLRVSATLTDRLPGAPLTRDQLKMLVEGGDQVCDPTPAIETFGVTPIGLDEQLRRAA